MIAAVASLVFCIGNVTTGQAVAEPMRQRPVVGETTPQDFGQSPSAEQQQVRANFFKYAQASKGRPSGTCTPVPQTIEHVVPMRSGRPIDSSIDGLATIVHRMDEFGIETGEERIPPEGWQPVTATDEELDYYRIPARPSTEPQLSSWFEEWSHFSGVLSTSDCVGSIEDTHSINVTP